VITVLYGYQTSMAFTASSSLVARPDAATLVFILFGVGLARAGNRLACAAEACLICSPPVVAGTGHRPAAAPGRPRRPALNPGPGHNGYCQLSGRAGPGAQGNAENVSAAKKGYARAPDNGPIGRPARTMAGRTHLFGMTAQPESATGWLLTTTIVCVVPGRAAFVVAAGRANAWSGHAAPAAAVAR